jgi:ABC-type antimicrobial peptide transport system permease subunit
MTMKDRMVRSVARPRLYAVVLGGFAGFAVVVAVVGLFGVLSYTVAQRSRELAVRSALGAQRRDIVGLVLRQGLAMTAAGIALGTLAALATARSLAALLYGVTPYDRLTYIAVPLLVALVSVLACLTPALRAARVDPMRALRSPL